MGINPIYKKELKMEVRGARLPIVILAFNCILALLGMIIFTTDVGIDFLSKFTSHSDLINIFSAMLTIEYILVLLIVPVYAASRVSREYEQNSMELLLLSKMKHFQIIWGKLCAVGTIILILIFSSIPVFAIVFYSGGISVVLFFKYVLVALATAMFVGSIGILFSTIFKNTIVAIALTYLTLLILTAGTYLIMEYVPVCMLVNPIFTMLKLMVNNSSSKEYLMDLVSGIGEDGVMVEHNTVVSVVLQIIISAIIIWATSSISKIRQYGNKLKRGCEKTPL